MIRLLVLAALAILLAQPGRAQIENAPARPVQVRNESLLGEAPRGAEMAPPSRFFEIRDGQLWMDGRALPPSSIPEGVDLSGVLMQVELVGAVTPVVEVDGVPYVLEGERLMRFEASEKSRGPVYIMGETVVAPSAAPVEQLEPVVNEAYRRQLSDVDRALYDKMERERVLENEIQGLARHARGLPPGEEHDALTADLRARLGRLFDLKQAIREQELTRAESELRSLRAVMGERESLRDQIILHRFNELMGQGPLDR